MVNYNSRIMSTAVSGINAQQASIAVIGNNIANVNTPGYSRRVVELEARASQNLGNSIDIGNGVDIGKISQQTSSFLQKLVQDAGGDLSRYQAEDGYLSRVQGLFSFNGDFVNVGKAFDAFFSAVNDLSANPSDIALRSNFVQKAEDLVSSIQTSYNTIAGLQTEADQRISTELNTVNSITAQIAALNSSIKANESLGNIDAGGRDQRNQLLEKLGEKISFTSTELPSGEINVTLSNGFALVTGNQNRQLEMLKSPSFLTAGATPSLDGGALGYIVYDYSQGAHTADTNLTDLLAAGGGSIGGLLRIRGTADPSDTSAFQAHGVLVEVASRIEGMTRTLLTDFNQSYLGPDRGGVPGVYSPSSGDLDGNVPDTFGLFTFNYSGTHDADGDGYPDFGDLAASNIDGFSKVLQVAFTDPRRVAAARDTSGPPWTNPPPAAAFAPGDSRNMEAISALQSQNFTFAAGNYSLTATCAGSYDEMVGQVGNLKNSSNVNVSVATANLNAARQNRDSVSSVSLNEEFTALIKSQNAYQASARLIKIADELMQQVVSLL